MSDATVEISVTSPVTAAEMHAVLAFAMEVQPSTYLRVEYPRVVMKFEATDFVRAIERMSGTYDADKNEAPRDHRGRFVKKEEAA